MGEMKKSSWFGFKQKTTKRNSSAEASTKNHQNEQKYRPIGLLSEDIISDLEEKNDIKKIELIQQTNLLRDILRQGVSSRSRGTVWRKASSPVLLDSNYGEVLKIKRDSITKKLTHCQKKIRDEKNCKIFDLIEKDVLRTRPDVIIFRDPRVQNSLSQILYLYTIDHPSVSYSQGMNEIIAPIFVSYLAENLNITYLQLENNFPIIQEKIDKPLEIATLDSYMTFEFLMNQIPYYFQKDFQGIQCNSKLMEKLIFKFDEKLYEFLKKTKMDYLTLIFRWNLCLLLKEFSLPVSIKLIDHFLSSDLELNEFILFLILALIFKFSNYIQSINGPKEKIMYFLNNLDFHRWGYQDIKGLVDDAICYHNKLIKK